MKAFIEKLPVGREESFYCKIHTTPRFEVPWHQHDSVELLFVLKGNGISYVGNHIGSFAPGDIFLIGSNLPHSFQKQNPEDTVSAIVIQFLHSCWGKGFLDLPESNVLRDLLERSARGFQLQDQLKQRVGNKLRLLEKQSGMKRLLALTDALEDIGQCGEYVVLSNQMAEALPDRHRERIDSVFQYSLEHYSEKITVPEIASLVNMTVPAFCHYFKKRTRKTYIDFLNEVRIGHACQQLRESNETIESVAFDCGYSSLANFNKQFLKIKAETPRSYRKRFKEVIGRRHRSIDLTMRQLSIPQR